MKKSIILFLTSILLVCAFTGCQSTLKAGLEREAFQNARHEITLKDCFSEEQGYHFPEMDWKMLYSEFQTKTFYSLDEVYSNYDDGSATYKSSSLYYYYNDRKNDDTLVTFSSESELLSVILMYTPDTSSVNSTTQQAAIYDAYYQEITALFGEEDDVRKASQTDNGVTADEYTHRWLFETASGLKTELQLSEIFISYTEEPDYVSLSFMIDITEE